MFFSRESEESRLRWRFNTRKGKGASHSTERNAGGKMAGSSLCSGMRRPNWLDMKFTLRRRRNRFRFFTELDG
jgi:hypothetical protein